MLRGVGSNGWQSWLFVLFKTEFVRCWFSSRRSLVGNEATLKDTILIIDSRVGQSPFMSYRPSTRDPRENGLSEDEDADAKATKRKRPDREEQPPQNYLRSFLRPSLPFGS